MAQLKFDEAEAYLLEHWADAVELEDAMDGVRKRYREMVESIGARVKERHPELDLFVEYFRGKWEGSIGFGRRAWFGDQMDPAGFWVSNLRLEYLCAPQEADPNSSIFIKPARKAGLDVARVKDDVRGKLGELLVASELERCAKEDNNQDVVVRFRMKSKQVMLEMLRTKPEEFIEEVVGEFDMLAKFVPVLDEAFARAKVGKVR